MGHYVPQHYLRAFEDPSEPGSVWTYDKVAKVSKLLPIQRVAQEPNYYNETDETALANHVEGPALHALASLRRQQRLDAGDRIRFAIYLASFLTRVPRRRAKALKMFPDALKSTVSKFRTALRHWVPDSPADAGLAVDSLAQLDTFEKRFADDPPPGVVNLIRSPWSFLNFVALLHDLTWRLVVSGSERFVTGDNPLFFFDAYGIGTPHAEVCCPLSPSVALHMCRKGLPGDFLVVSGRPVVVKEINRRIATSAVRFVFSSDSASWLPPVCGKPQPHFNSLNW